MDLIWMGNLNIWKCGHYSISDVTMLFFYNATAVKKNITEVDQLWVSPCSPFFSLFEAAFNFFFLFWRGGAGTFASKIFEILFKKNLGSPNIFSINVWFLFVKSQD